MAAELSARPVKTCVADSGIFFPLLIERLPGSSMFIFVFMLALLPTFMLLLFELSWLLLLLLLLLFSLALLTRLAATLAATTPAVRYPHTEVPLPPETKIYLKIGFLF